MTNLSNTQLDRACGTLLAGAAGDALGAPHEFHQPLPADYQLAMTGNGTWKPGEWTDDTSMAIAIAEVAADGSDLRTDAAQDRIVARWVGWSKNAKDVGILIGSVLRQLGSGGAVEARATAKALHERTGQSGGNGSLMRTAPVALAYLDDEAGLVDATTAISALTHYDPEAGEACVLWCLAIRHAVLTGELDIRVGLDRLAADRRQIWADRIATAETSHPADFHNNGWVVEAFQGAWSAIHTTPVPADDPRAVSFRVDHLRHALQAAVRGGRDADTVAAIAGGLLGAAYGASAVPAEWRLRLNGWPGMHTRDLVALATRIVHHGAPDIFDPTYARFSHRNVLAKHPYDDGLWLGGVGPLLALPPGVDAVVSLCRVGDPPPVPDFVEVRLIDQTGQNANLDFILHDTVSLIEQLRHQGRTVLLHCVQAESRTPTVAALYGMRKRGVSSDIALVGIKQALPDAHPNAEFRAALHAADPHQT